MTIMMNITVPLPEQIERRLTRLTKTNFRLWMFIAQQSLWEEAVDFVDDHSLDREDYPFEDEW